MLLRAVLLTCLGLVLVLPGAASAVESGGPAVAEKHVAKKRGCDTKKSKAARDRCRKLRKSGKYKKGQVCSLAAEKQREYARYGFMCLDLSVRQDGSLTYLENL